jgi:hypothetical protein
MAILFFAGIMQMDNLLANAKTVSDMQSLGQPTGTDFNLVSFVTTVWSYMKVFIPMIFLYNATVWSGYWIWFYFFVCLPICVGMVFSIVTIMRGSSSS